MLEEISIILLIIAVIVYFIGKYLYEKYNDED
jgi:putative effector of murein hydrolase